MTLDSRVAVQLLYIDDNGDFDRIRSAWAGNVSHLITAVLLLLSVLGWIGKVAEVARDLIAIAKVTNQTCIERIFIQLFKLVWYGPIS